MKTIVITGCRGIMGYWYEDLIGHTFEVIKEDQIDYEVINREGLVRHIRVSDATVIIENGVLNIQVISKIHIKILQGHRWRAYANKIKSGEYPNPVTDADFRKAYNFATKTSKGV